MRSAWTLLRASTGPSHTTGDLNNRSHAWNDRVKGKTENGIWPNMTQAGDYGATFHYLKAVADMGVPAAKADGRAAIERMKRMPTDDDCIGPGRIREDGSALHPVYLFRAKKPSESKQRGTWRSL